MDILPTLQQMISLTNSLFLAKPGKMVLEVCSPLEKLVITMVTGKVIKYRWERGQLRSEEANLEGLNLCKPWLNQIFAVVSC